MKGQLPLDRAFADVADYTAVVTSHSDSAIVDPQTGSVAVGRILYSNNRIFVFMNDLGRLLYANDKADCASNSIRLRVFSLAQRIPGDRG